MAVSLRNNQSGQSIVEYLLVLVVSVVVILGGMYQLNSAFKSWANNYFGNYLACLLETGELPTISGSPGDSGICNQLFKPFSLADGRPLLGKGEAKEAPPAKGNGNGQREGRGGGGSYAGGGGYRGTPFTGGKDFGKGGGKKPGAGGGAGGPTNTGNLGVSSGGGGYSASARSGTNGRPIRLDQRFAFDDRPEGKRNVASAPSKPGEFGDGSQKKIKVPQRDQKKAEMNGGDTSFTISDFIRFLIIAAIVIAVILFLGGQALQIGKGMDG